MATWYSNLQEPHMANLLNGSKKIEGRPYRDKWALMKKDDTIIFNGEHEFLIIDKEKYPNLISMLVFEGVKNVIPGANTFSDAEDVYIKTSTNSGGIYNVEDFKDGVVAISLVKKV